MSKPPQALLHTRLLTPAQRSVLAALERVWQAGGSVDSLDALCALLGLRSRGALHRHVEALVKGGFVLPLDRHRHGLRPGPAAQAAHAMPPSLGTADTTSSAALGGREVAAAGRDLAAARPDTACAPAPRPDDAGRTRHTVDTAPDAARAAWPQARLRALPRLGRIAAGAPLDAVFDEEPVWIPEQLVPAGEAYVLEVRGDSMSGDGIFDGDLVVVEVGTRVRPGEIAVVLIAGEGATLKRFRQEGAQIRLQASNPAVEDRLVAAETVAIQGRIRGLMRRYGA